MRWPPPCPEVTSCPLVSGSQSRAPGAAGGEGLRAQEGVGVSPGGAEHSAAAEGPPGERAGGAAQRPDPGTFLLLPPSSSGFGARSRPLPLASPAGPSGHPRGPQTHPGQWAPSPPPPSAGLTCSSVLPSLGHPITSPGLTLGLQRPHHCGAPSSTPQPLLAHLHSTGLTPPWAPAALPGERSAHDSESPSLAPLLG